jgi:hypothetical protein
MVALVAPPHYHYSNLTNVPGGCMRRPTILLLAVTAALVGCLNDPLGADIDPDEPLPPLETIPFAALGSARIAFHRIGPAPVRYAGVYWIDGALSASGPSQTAVSDPSISPDGSKIAFRAPSGSISQWDIWVSSTHGTDHQRITDVTGTAEGPPSWSPDSHVLYPLWGNPARIMKHPPFATTVAELVAAIAPSGTDLCPWYVPGDGPVAMRDDGTILFTCQWNAIYSKGPGEAEPELIFSRPQGMGHLRQAVWSPDGQHVAFAEWIPPGATTGGAVHIHVIDLDGQNRNNIASVEQPAGARYYGDQSVASLCWSASGTTIVFTAPEGDLVSRVFAVPAGGGAVTKITSAPGTSDGSVSCAR